MKLDEEAAASGAPTTKRDRHVVTWTPQEDDLLREQVSILGTDSWTCIAAQFKDKTSRQCRRRWYTYLNSECRKGGWSTEEDMLLCEAQKMFGNKWTEIAKLVSGRTDNAVKNRFSTLCKKRAKLEALSKENDGSFVDPNNKGVLIQNGSIAVQTPESSAPLKKIRLLGQLGLVDKELRPPLAVLVPNIGNVGGFPTQHHVASNTNAAVYDASNDKAQGTFLKKDDPKLNALLQQADLLSSLAQKVSTNKTNQSLDDAWKELQDYLNQTEECGLLGRNISEINALLEDFKDLIEDLKSSNTGSQLSRRQPDLCEDSQGSQENSTGLIHHSNVQGNEKEQHLANECSVNQNANASDHHEDGSCAGQVASLSSSGEPKDDNGIVPTVPNSEFSSPLQMIQLFRSFVEGIPTPEFTASERHFLQSALDLSSPLRSPNSNPSQPPSCKRALINSL